MKAKWLLISASLLCCLAMSRRPTTPPVAPGTNIPPLAQNVSFTASVSLESGPTILIPYIGATVWGNGTLNQATKLFTARATKATHSLPIDKATVSRTIDFEISANNAFITGHVVKSNAEIYWTVTRTDTSNFAVRASGTALGEPVSVVGSGVLQSVISAPVAKWSVREIRSFGGNWKVKFIEDVKRGTLYSIFDRKTRNKSELWENTKRVYSGVEETIGAEVIEPAVVDGNWLYMAAERGDKVIRYDLNSGSVSKAARIPSGYKWNVVTGTWKGTPVVGAAGPDKKSILFDARNGKTLFTFPVSGLIAQLSEGPDGEMWAAISDTTWGIYSTGGKQYRDFKPASIAWVNGVLYAGGMDDAKLWRRDGSKWVLVKDFDASKINELIPASDGSLLIACSKPDTFARLTGAGIEIIARYTDEKREKSGQQFDTVIRMRNNGSIIMGREKPTGCSFYEAVR